MCVCCATKDFVIFYLTRVETLKVKKIYIIPRWKYENEIRTPSPIYISIMYRGAQKAFNVIYIQNMYDISSYYIKKRRYFHLYMYLVYINVSNTKHTYILDIRNCGSITKSTYYPSRESIVLIYIY